MFQTSRLWRKILWVVVGSLISGVTLYTGHPPLDVAAQSTGDTLPTPIGSPLASPTPAGQVWVGRLVSNTLGVTKGQGSIFRVSVEGLRDTPIELRNSDQLIVARSGSKPEYGTYAAEFAPVTKGIWTVTVPAIGVSLEVEADNYNLAVIEFEQIAAPEATRTLSPAATPTPLGGRDWTARLVSENRAGGTPFSRLLIRVVGRDNQPVRLSTVSQVINTANTGQKPDELGPNMVEFTGLTPGKYIVEPLGLNVSLEVGLKPDIETLVEFSPQVPPLGAPAATATSTSMPPPPALSPTIPPATPTLTSTPIPAEIATVAPSPTYVPLLPSFTPTPVTRWVGVIEARSPLEPTEASRIIARVAGIEGLPVRLNGSNSTEKRCLTGRDELGQDICVFDDLGPGHYVIAPEGIGSNLPVMLSAHEAVQVGFEVEILPPGVAGWKSNLMKNTSSSQALPQVESAIKVRVLGREGQIITLRSVRGTERLCEVTPNPVLGYLACEFGELGPGVYTVEAINTGANLQVFVDGVGQAEIEFSPTATSETLALKQSAPVVGWGVRPQQATATPIPPVVAPPVTVGDIEPTSTPSASPAPTLTPAPVWQGRVVESKPFGGGVIGVRVLGLQGHPVILRSGTWQSAPQLTGAKPELGEYAVEFGGLGPGRYVVDLVDLAQLEVELPSGQFILVEFREE